MRDVEHTIHRSRDALPVPTLRRLDAHVIAIDCAYAVDLSVKLSVLKYVRHRARSHAKAGGLCVRDKKNSPVGLREELFSLHGERYVKTLHRELLDPFQSQSLFHLHQGRGGLAIFLGDFPPQLYLRLAGCRDRAGFVLDSARRIQTRIPRLRLADARVALTVPRFRTNFCDLSVAASSTARYTTRGRHRFIGFADLAPLRVSALPRQINDLAMVGGRACAASGQQSTIQVGHFGSLGSIGRGPPEASHDRQQRVSNWTLYWVTALFRVDMAAYTVLAKATNQDMGKGSLRQSMAVPS